MGQGLCICGIKLDHPRIVSQRAVQILLFFTSAGAPEIDSRVFRLERQRGVLVFGSLRRLRIASHSEHNAINNGWVPGPRIVGAGISFGIRGGHCDETDGLWPGALGEEHGIESGIANGADEVRNAVRYVVKYGADVIKICATGGVLSPTDSVGAQQYTEDEMRVIV